MIVISIITFSKTKYIALNYTEFCGVMGLMNTDYESKVIVLKPTIDEETTKQMVEEKKTNLFKKLLKKPKRDEVHVHSLKLYHEAILMISGKYTADFYRKAVHPIKVDYNVSEVVLGDGVFPIRTKSGLQKAFSGNRGKNKVDLELEEHVFIENKDTMYFDHHGREIKFPFKISSKTVENYPKRILKNNDANVKRPEITNKTAFTRLSEKLKRPLEPDVRDLNDELTVDEISEIYIPIYEARLIGPKKKVELMRIDAVRKKIL